MGEPKGPAVEPATPGAAKLVRSDLDGAKPGYWVHLDGRPEQAAGWWTLGAEEASGTRDEARAIGQTIDVVVKLELICEEGEKPFEIASIEGQEDGGVCPKYPGRE